MGKRSRRPRAARSGAERQAPADPTTTVRLYVAGRMVDEATVANDDELTAAGTRQGEACLEAEQRGQRWMVEMVFPDGEHVRWGSDPGGMVEPIWVEGSELPDTVARQRGWLR